MNGKTYKNNLFNVHYFNAVLSDSMYNIMAKSDLDPRRHYRQGKFLRQKISYIRTSRQRYVSTFVFQILP